MRKLCLYLIIAVVSFTTYAQDRNKGVPKSEAWQADLGNGMYQNPVLYADYSDPDVCRVGDDYYMISSSFNCVPGIPVLHSKDLVNWQLITHALKRQPPFGHYSKSQHGNGVWAPAIRYHNGEFYIYYPDPDFGIYLLKSKEPAGPWSEPLLVEGGKGLIDPCPLWDDDGKAYLVYAYAGSRAGIKSILAVKQLSPDGTTTLDAGRIVYDGHEIDPTVEGPKFHKRNGYYYIFAPAGGVATGWQIVLRSKNVYGPYERRIVMNQGKTSINGPHQGAWVDTPAGEHWFIHFQDLDAYGRVVHLQPMVWKNDWPVIGLDKDGDNIGEPVSKYKKPSGGVSDVITPPDTDEFDSPELGRQWQWHANPMATWSFLTSDGKLRLYTQKPPDSARSLWDVPNLLLQKIPAPQFTATTKLTFHANEKLQMEKVGLVVMGASYSSIALRSGKDGNQLVVATCKNADKGQSENEKIVAAVKGGEIYMRVQMKHGAKYVFSYSLDGKKFLPVEGEWQAEPGRWIGAKVGLFAVRDAQINDAGYADFDWFRVTK